VHDVRGAGRSAVAPPRSRFWLAIGALGLAFLRCSESMLHAGSPEPAARQQVAAAPPALQPSVVVIAGAIRVRLATGSPGPSRATPTERKDLASLYEPDAHAPLWVDAAGAPTLNARHALALLEGATMDGLEPAEYAAAGLRDALITLLRPGRPSNDDIADFDVTMSASMLRYLRHLHLGRVDPRTIGFSLDVPADRHDFVMLLRSALGDQRIPETAAELAPPLAQYRLLRSMLARYRSLATDSDLEEVPRFAGPLRPGDPYEGLDVLYRRLLALGDLPSDTPAPREDALYGESLVDGVRRFQSRHGLESDGIVGTATQAALQVPLAWRVRQIELALERLRWLPDLGDQRFIGLNIPMFHLWAWDSTRPTGSPAFGMRAIVGRALSTQTPVFVEEMRYVVFRPYWNVPRSILRNEILPIVERDPDYLRRQHMEIVRGPGDDAQPVAATPENLALLRQGVLRLRQRPGPHNALGLVKFVFPNNENVYLHGTPAQELFARTRRDFSHGCVRVEDPASLAEWVLNDQPEWTRVRILAAMSAPVPRRVNLTRPIQVVLFYLTAAVMPEDGTIHFAEDIYRHDAKLDRALALAMSVRAPRSGRLRRSP
jgi:L,D-transpeptidase YcbB